MNKKTNLRELEKMEEGAKKIRVKLPKEKVR